PKHPEVRPLTSTGITGFRGTMGLSDSRRGHHPTVALRVPPAHLLRVSRVASKNHPCMPLPNYPGVHHGAGGGTQRQFRQLISEEQHDNTRSHVEKRNRGRSAVLEGSVASRAATHFSHG